MANKKISIKEIIRSLALTTVGTACTGLAVSCFLSPNRIVGGGASGISTILYHAFGIPLGVSSISINLFLLLCGFKSIGKEFTAKTLVGAGLISAFIALFAEILPPLTENAMIATLFGGALYGLGIALTFVAGASTGGTDIIGRIIQSKLENFPIGKLLMVVDGIIILCSAFVFKDMDLIFLGVLSMFLATTVIDFFIKRMNVSKIAFVITGKGEDIAAKIVATSPRGVTRINVVGAYTNTDKAMLFCAMKESEFPNFQKKVLAIDPTAFIVYSSSQEIMGKGFYIYR